MEKKKMEKIERKEERKMKDYRLVVNAWFAYKNDLPQYPAKIYEVREKAINCLFFKKAEKEESYENNNKRFSMLKRCRQDKYKLN